MMSNLISQLEIQKASDRLPDVLAEIPRVRAEVGYPPLVTPMSQIVGTQAVLNVLTGKRWSVIPSEMKDYLKGYYGKAPGPQDREIVKKVLGDETPVAPDIRPGSLITTTFAEVEAEVGDLARSEEDVLMYALFPNEARQYLSTHREGAEKAVFLVSEELHTVREDESVDVNQIRELIKVVESSDITEITIEEGDTKVSIRKGGVASAPVAAAPAPVVAPAADSAGDAAVATAPAPGERPAGWKTVVAPMVGTFYEAASPGSPAFVAVGDSFSEGQPLCILEAMKLMNEIVADEPGVVREIGVKNGDPVEYGTVLFTYESL
jgi:oxaloacetate decarboxylase alpha subunit